MPKQNTSERKTSRRLSNIVKPDNLSLVEWQQILRREAAEREQLAVTEVDGQLSSGIYQVANPKNGQKYKVVFHGDGNGWNYCSCMDFKTSRLGTCKHIEAVKLHVEQHKLPVRPFAPEYTSVFLSYRYGREVCIRVGSHVEEFKPLIRQYFDARGRMRPESYAQFDVFLSKAKEIDPDFRCYPDALDYIVEQRDMATRHRLVDEKYTDAAMDALLRTRLFPYQKEGIRFAAKAGCSIIADEMGLGKTIQAIGTAELLRKEGLVENVLVVCPSSLKYQWKHEIERFTAAEVLAIEGGHEARCRQYLMGQPYKIVSYNSLSNDLKLLNHFSTDMVIMDEVQRLKNWDTQIAKSARLIRAPYRMLLSGTPLENKLEELFSIVELADQFCLGPYYLFRDRHIRTDETGKVVGYDNLNEVSEELKNIMLRRRKRDVALQLPPRMDKTIFVTMTPEQRELHDDFKAGAAKLVFRWRRNHFLSETDRKRLMLLLSKMRMVCDSSYVLDQVSRYDTKIDELMNLLEGVFAEGNQKVVVFSQWERMTRLVAQELTRRGVGFSYLHGGVPSVRRKDLVIDFTDNPATRVFLSTDAGSTGLNLQAASLLVNLDLPWNPAVLEQRVARIYRIGQQCSVQVVNLVSANSFEEEMLGRLKFKSSLFEGVLDGGEDTIFINQDKFKGVLAVVGDYLEDTPVDNPIRETAATTVVTPPPDADMLAARGRSLLVGLAKSLASPESTRQLVDNIVREDPATGQNYLNIPVADKQTVTQLLTLVGKLFNNT